MTFLRFRAKDFGAQLSAFVGTGEASPDVRAAVAGIIADVKKRGDAAVLAYTAKFDRAKLTAARQRIPLAELRRAASTSPAARCRSFPRC